MAELGKASKLKRFGRQLAQARRQAGLTQQELAVRMGLDSGESVSRYERGIREPRLSTVYELCDAIGITALELLALEVSVPSSEAHAAAAFETTTDEHAGHDAMERDAMERDATVYDAMGHDVSALDGGDATARALREQIVENTGWLSEANLRVVSDLIAVIARHASASGSAVNAPDDGTPVRVVDAPQQERERRAVPAERSLNRKSS